MEKANYGQFFTGENISKWMVNIIEDIKPISGDILEPSFGTGDFLDILSTYGNVDAVEIDTVHFTKYNNPKVNLYNSDFIMDFNPDKKYDFIIGNPPYIELCYSFYNKEEQELLKVQYPKYKGRLNLVHIFLSKSFELLKEGGIIAYLLPSSVLTSPIYKEIRKQIYGEYQIKYLQEDIKFPGVAIKVSILIIEKGKVNDDFFYLNNQMYYIMENYKIFSDNPTLGDVGFEVSIGEVVWNQHKDKLSKSGDRVLIYSSNITGRDEITIPVKRVEERQYVSGEIEPKYTNCIVFPRTVSKKLKYKKLYNNEFVFENHTIVITHKDINKLDEFYNNLQECKYDAFFQSFFNSSNITKSEILSIPF